MDGRRSNSSVTKELWKRQVWKLPWLLLIPIGLLLPSLSAKYPGFIETQYSQKLYPKISGALGGLSAALPGSIAELIVYILIAFAVGMVILLLTLILQRRQRLVRLVSFILSLCICVGVAINLMYWLWGFNYSRTDLSERMNLKIEEHSTEQLETLCLRLSQEAKMLRNGLEEDETGVFKLKYDIPTCFSMLTDAYSRLGQAYPIFSAKTYPPKTVYASEAMSYAGICGIYIPFTAEANVNIHQPPLLLLSSGAHEMAHYLGTAKEDEANFVGYLACLHSDDPSIRYSGIMLALIHAGNQLNDADSMAFTLLRATYSDAMLRDLSAYNAYWDKYEGKVEESIDKLNDNYLKHNQQSDGVKSYGMMVDLLLAYYDQ